MMRIGIPKENNEKETRVAIVPVSIPKLMKLGFEVVIEKVSTMNFKGKKKNMTIKSDGHILRTSGNRSNWKKAIVTLDKDSKINLVEGEF